MEGNEEIGEIEQHIMELEHEDSSNDENMGAENNKQTNDSSKADKNVDDQNIEDSDHTCPICMEQWTSSGDHRLCCLRCGHLFGYSCILKWLQCAYTSANRRCPQCNKKASTKQIRFLYARKLMSKDTIELEETRKSLREVTDEKNQMQTELTQCRIQLKVYEQQLSCMKNRVTELENQQAEIYTHKNQNASNGFAQKFHLERSVDISEGGECRVFDYNPCYKYLAVSQKTTNLLFTGYGVKRINPEDFSRQQFLYLHAKSIRDITFHSMQKTLLLSVGFDKCAKLTDFQNNLTVHTYQVEHPLWSCCWSGDNSNLFLVGAQNGSITQFDIRQISNPVETLEGPTDRSPVVSLATILPNPNSNFTKCGLIACRLNTCYVYEVRNSNYLAKQIFLEGPFVSVRYDERNNHALISSRPNATHPCARHLVCALESSEDEIRCNVVHEFHAGNSQKLLSRPCHIYMDNDTLVAAHQETNNSISIWSTANGKQFQVLPTLDPVMDLCSFLIQDNLMLASLSTTKLRLYNCVKIGDG